MTAAATTTRPAITAARRPCAACSRDFTAGRWARALCWPCRQRPEVRAAFRVGGKYTRRGVADYNGPVTPADAPTPAPPGSPGKVAAMEARAAAGVSLWHEGDAGWGEA